MWCAMESKALVVRNTLASWKLSNAQVGSLQDKTLIPFSCLVPEPAVPSRYCQVW